jgi:hypothetical protein
MKKDALTQALDSLWGANIMEGLEIDLCSMKIGFTLRDAPHLRRYEIQFKKVKSFLFSSLTDKARDYDWEYMDLTGIYYYPKGEDANRVIYKSLDQGLEYVSGPNFVLEIWSTQFLIDADIIVIDGETFQAR